MSRATRQRLAAHRERKAAAMRKELAKFRDGFGWQRAESSRQRAVNGRALG